MPYKDEFWCCNHCGESFHCKKEATHHEANCDENPDNTVSEEE